MRGESEERGRRDKEGEEESENDAQMRGESEERGRRDKEGEEESENGALSELVGI